jgi:hypothetical protein
MEEDGRTFRWRRKRVVERLGRERNKLLLS